MIRLSVFFCFLLLNLSACVTKPATEVTLPFASEGVSILSTIDAFFLALAAGDADAIDRLQSSQSITVTANPETDQSIRYGLGADLITNMREGTFPKIVEPYWDPIVLQRKSLAIVWAPYQVSVDDKLIHCGIDIFNLSKHHEDWKIDAVSWTAEPSSCEELWPNDKSAFRPKFP